jgi:parallel beta-helix repeat protein
MQLSIRAVSSNGPGILLGGLNHLVKDCTVLENASYGIAVGKGCTVTGNTVYGNGGRGISVYQSCTVTGNTCFDNNSDGIHADGSGSTITGNTVRDNGDWGITVLDACSITGNTVRNNGNGGIAVRYYCLVKNNTLKGNNPSNIHVIQAGNSIEENLVADSTYGIYFQGPGSFFANNRASGNGTDYFNTAVNTDGGGNVSF